MALHCSLVANPQLKRLCSLIRHQSSALASESVMATAAIASNAFIVGTIIVLDDGFILRFPIPLIAPLSERHGNERRIILPGVDRKASNDVKRLQHFIIVVRSSYLLHMVAIIA